MKDIDIQLKKLEEKIAKEACAIGYKQYGIGWHISKLDQIVKEAQIELDSFKKTLADRDLEEEEKNKQERIAALKNQLRDLES